MWAYEKRLEFPVKITNTNPKIAQVIMSQYGGPNFQKQSSMHSADNLSLDYGMQKRSSFHLLLRPINHKFSYSCIYLPPQLNYPTALHKLPHHSFSVIRLDSPLYR